jgi:hypothetical protein
VVIRTEARHVHLFIEGEEIPVLHHEGKRPFGTQFLPHVHFDSLENLAKALVQHRFPGGAP